MSYCINPWCPDRKNPDKPVDIASLQQAGRCLACDTPLLVCDRYRLIRPLRDPDEWEASEIFEVEDYGQPDASSTDQRPTKVLKSLKKPALLPLFEREAKTLQHLRHPGIPQVESDGYFAVELADGRALSCLVMENIKGVNLDEWLQKHGPVDQATAIDWMSQLAELLAQLHKSELFHRDIKLSNIMLRPTGQLALIDFGTVRPLTNTYFAKVASQRDITSVVSPGYTPLEQINGRAVPQSDFYALGRSFIYLLTGKHPIDLPEDESTGQLSWRDQTKFPISDWLAQLLNDMTAPFPGQRPLSAEVLLDRLTKQQTRRAAWGPKQQLRVLAAVNLVLLLLQIWVGWQWMSTRREMEKVGIWNSENNEQPKTNNSPHPFLMADLRSQKRFGFGLGLLEG